MYFDYSVMLYEMKGIEETIATARQWQERYESDHIRIRTVKFFGDGSSEAGDVLSLVPFANDPTGKNYGKCNFTLEECIHACTWANAERMRILDKVGSIDPVCTYFDGQEMHFPNPVKK